MGAAEIAFISVLFVIMLAWFYRVVLYRDASGMAGVTACDNTQTDDDDAEAATPDYTTDDDHLIGHPAFADQDGFANGAMAPQGPGKVGSPQAVMDLKPFGDSNMDLTTSEARQGAPIHQVTTTATDGGGTGGIKRQKNRYARAMAAQRQWQLHNASQLVNQKANNRRNALGGKVGFQALMDLYQGDTLPAPRKVAGPYRKRVHMVDGHPDSAGLARMAQATGVQPMTGQL